MGHTKPLFFVLILLGFFGDGGYGITSVSGFTKIADYGTGSFPQFIFASDINNDSYPDVVVSNRYSDTFSYFENNGNGTFKKKVDYATGALPEGIFATDFNNDGYTDVIVANGLERTLSYFENKGNGTFKDKVDYIVGTCPIGIFASDFDNDGDSDIITANWDVNNRISYFENDGKGLFNNTFSYPKSSTDGCRFGDWVVYDSFIRPTSVFASDFNDDGLPDLVLTNRDSTFSYFENEGDGTFKEKANYTTGSFPQFIFASDINNDSYPDVVVSNKNSDTVSYFENEGDGTFKEKVDYTTGHSPKAIFAGDFDNDEDQDLVVANYDSVIGIYPRSAISYFENTGKGIFKSKVDYKTGEAPAEIHQFGICASDFDKDGDLDVITTNKYSNTISYLENSGVWIENLQEAEVIILSSWEKLKQRYDEYAEIVKLIYELEDVIEKYEKFIASVLFIDDKNLAEQYGIGNIDISNAAAIDGALETILSKKTKYIIIVGGNEVIPFYMKPFDVDDDKLVPTDDIYSDVSNDGSLDIAIGRMPDGKSPDATLLMNQLSSAIKYHKERNNFDREDLFAVGAERWFNMTLFFIKRKILSLTKSIKSSPPLSKLEESLYPAYLNKEIQIFDVHGTKGGIFQMFVGEGADPSFPIYPVVLIPPLVTSNRNSSSQRSLILSSTCYGSDIIERDTEDSIPLEYLKRGAIAYIGSTGICWECYQSVCGCNLFLSKFIRNLQGSKIGYAFLRAKNASKYSEFFVKKEKILTEYILFGDPTIQINSFG